MLDDSIRSDPTAPPTFFVWLPEDLDAIASAASAAGRWVEAGEFGAERISMVTDVGLPYGIDRTLWEVVPDAQVHVVPFVDQLKHAPAESIPSEEQQHLVERARFVRPVSAWNTDVAARFVTEAAERAQQRLLQALDDARSMFAEGSDHAGSVDELDRQGSCLSLVQELSTVWIRALSAQVSGDPITAARSFAWAAAESREYSAVNYASTSDAGDEAQARSTSYLESRRWQARLLIDLLGVAPTG